MYYMSIEFVPAKTKLKKDRLKRRQDHGTRGNVFPDYPSCTQERYAGARRRMTHIALREGLADTKPINPEDALDFTDPINLHAELAAREAEQRRAIECLLSEAREDEDLDDADDEYEDEMPEEWLLHNRRRTAKKALAVQAELDPEREKDFRENEDFPNGFSFTIPR